MLNTLYEAVGESRDPQELASNIRRLAQALEKLPTINSEIKAMHSHSENEWDDAVFCDDKYKAHHQRMAELYEREMEMLEVAA
jgi:hypothetical protein